MWPLVVGAAAFAASWDLCPAASSAGWRLAGDAIVPPESSKAGYRVDVVAQGMFGRLFAALNARGVQPVVVLLPTRRSMVYAPGGTGAPPEKYNWAEERAQYLATRTWIEAQGVIVPDLLELGLRLRADGPPLFRDDDGHWTTLGARAVAERVADAIRSSGPKAWMGSAPIDLVDPKLQDAGPGHYAAALAKLCKVKASGAYQRTTWTVRDARPAPGLLDERGPPPVAVVGSSFAAPAYLFSPALSAALDADVLNVAVAGGRSTSALRQWLESENYASAPPQVVVWILQVNHAFGTAPAALGTLSQAEGFRQLLPLVDGGCTAAEAERSLRPQADGILLGTRDAPLTGPGRYLSLEGAALTGVRFTVTVKYADGSAHTGVVASDPRVPARPLALYELPQDVGSPIVGVSVASPSWKSTPDVDARVCRYRDPVAQTPR